jgi:hypothetical protein
LVPNFIFFFLSSFFGGGERRVCRIFDLGEKVGVEEDLDPIKTVDFCLKWFLYDEGLQLGVLLL